MSREKNLVKNTLVISIGTFLPKLTSLVTLPIITAGLTKVEYGTYDLISTLVSLLLPIVTMQIQAAAFRFLIDCREDKKKTDSIITNIMLFSIPVFIIFLIILYIALRDLGGVTGLLICLYFFADIMMMTILQVVRGLSYNKLYSASAVIQSVINMLLVVYTISLKDWGLYGVLFSVSIATLVSVGFLICRGHILAHLNIKYFNWAEIKSMLSYSWPMVPNSLSNWVLSLADRAVLTAFIGLEATALYAVANKIPMLFTTFQGTFIFAWQENASLAIKDKDADDYYTKMFDYVFRIICGMMAVLISCTPVIFTLLIRGDYSASYTQMPILFMALLFSAGASFLGGIYVAHKKTKNVGMTTIIAAAINLIIDLLFVKKIGLFAASISTLVSYLFLFIYRMFNVRRFQVIKYDYAKISLFIGTLVFMCILCWMNTLSFNIINVVIGFAFALLINRKIATDILNIFKNKLGRH